MRMQTNQQWGYLAPEIEVNETCVEQGFIGTQLGGIDPNPTNPGENPQLPEGDTEW